VTAVNRLKGNPMRVTIIPAISSITIHPGSSCFKTFAAAWEIHMAPPLNITVIKMADAICIPDNKKQSKRPKKEPNVPGANGTCPK
jgi:hypothetical protein